MSQTTLRPIGTEFQTFKESERWRVITTWRVIAHTDPANGQSPQEVVDAITVKMAEKMPPGGEERKS